jgi:regulatory protein
MAALKMLARRELSEAQVRQRLVRRQYDRESIEAAIERLKANRSIDDARVAGAIARTEAMLRHRGRRRVEQQLAAAGLAPDIAQRALQHVFDDIDPDAMLANALDKRLCGRSVVADAREFARLYRQLTRQGFDSHRVLEVLRARRAADRRDVEDL